MLKTLLKKIFFSKTTVDKGKVSNILIVKLFAIGDCLNATPAVKQLRKAFPTANLDVLVGNWSAPVFHNNPHINRTIEVEDSWFRKPDLLSLLGLILRLRRKKYDALLLFHRDPKLGAFFALTGISVRIGLDIEGDGYWMTHPVGENEIKHEIEIYNSLLEPFGVLAEYIDMEIFPSAIEIETGQKFWKESGLSSEAPIIGIAPGGASNPGEVMPQRVWKRYRELVNKLLTEDYQIAYFGGPSDKRELESLPLNNRAVSFIGKGSLAISAELMKRCNVIVAHDSGPMHLAATTCVPIISIFGPTDPIRKAPIGSQHRYFASNNECAPCYHRGSWDQDCSKECIATVSVDQIMDAIINLTRN